MKLCREMKKSFSKIEKLFSPNELKEFIACAPGNLDRYHFGLGTWIRNELLKDGSPLTARFLRGGVLQKDDMSQLLIELFHLYVRNKYL